jgi:hypothetical protein
VTAPKWYDKTEVIWQLVYDYAEVVGTKRTTYRLRGGYPVEPYESDDIDRVRIALPQRDVFSKNRATIKSAEVNWTSMGDRDADHAAAYAALIARAARIAQRANAEKEAWVLRADKARDKWKAQIERERAKEAKP